MCSGLHWGWFFSAIGCHIKLVRSEPKPYLFTPIAVFFSDSRATIYLFLSPQKLHFIYCLSRPNETRAICASLCSPRLGFLPSASPMLLLFDERTQQVSIPLIPNEMRLTSHKLLTKTCLPTLRSSSHPRMSRRELMGVHCEISASGANGMLTLIACLLQNDSFFLGELFQNVNVRHTPMPSFACRANHRRVTLPLFPVREADMTTLWRPI